VRRPATPRVLFELVCTKSRMDGARCSSAHPSGHPKVKITKFTKGREKSSPLEGVKFYKLLHNRNKLNLSTIFIWKNSSMIEGNIEKIGKLLLSNYFARFVGGVV
jgi:hypothetical protein